jgi:hypothetical protein
VAYDRDAALSYARTYWNRPASDGYVAGKFGGKAFRQVPDGTVFVHVDDDTDAPEHALLPDGTLIPWSALDDCTHFMSCCTGSPPGGGAGGLYIPSDFPVAGPYGILGANRFVQNLVQKGHVEVLPVADKANPGLERIAPGDLIGYHQESVGLYAHLVMYAGDGNIVCHSYCRSDAAECTWDHSYALGADNGDWQWRLLRVTG